MGDDSLRSRYHRLQRFAESDSPALTIRYGRRLLADYPDFWPAWMEVGRALVDLGRYEEAEQAFAKVLEHCSPEARQLPHSQFGHLFLEAGDYNQAAEWYRKAVEAAPGDEKYLIFLGAVLAKQGRFHEAEEAHRAAIECGGDCLYEAYFNLGLVLRARERFGQAADCFREAIRLHPEFPLARRALRDVERCIKLEEK
jgi:tetratricopeptide (TPR) repeat protein